MKILFCIKVIAKQGFQVIKINCRLSPFKNVAEIVKKPAGYL